MMILPIFIVSWIVMSTFSTIMILFGWVLIPPMALLNKYTTEYTTSVINGRQILVWKHKFMYPWSNNEDGINGGEEYPDKPLWFRIIYWSAVRNPANNLRFFKFLTCQLDPAKIKFELSTPMDILGRSPESTPRLEIYDDDSFRFITLTWQGLLSNLRIQFKMGSHIWRFWVGWKIYPHDSLGISPSDYRHMGAGFAMQFKRIYPKN